MNRHAEKPLKEVGSEESALFDADLGGVLSAIHYCPGCGKVEVQNRGALGIRADGYRPVCVVQ